ncbi:hydantoinase B/oxoprolinase family protein [Peribacillus aracenensis]|uniref:hydantoinase B/oxoprolinase family protein n=1 Tax=Peribacillus aracenensis TaxID=2976708 RepID=UPI0021A6C0C2|nr:hydantoinase B/oxoprolinase family protein [Peribacillus sp. BBB004]
MKQRDIFLNAQEVEKRYGIDLITAETIRAGLIETSRHMATSLQHSAFSNAVREALDMGVCVHLVGQEGTEMVSITEGVTQFAFTHQHMTNMVIDEWGLENLGPGDTIICNDNWRGGIHFPDANLFRPVFWQGEVVFILSCASHLLDIGGPVAGGVNAPANSLYEEGLRIPPTLILSGDKPVRSTINLLIENTRLPIHNLGDLRALFGTLKVGEARLIRLLERYGLEAVRSGGSYTLDLAERRMRNEILQVTDGIYEAEEFIDDDGNGGPPLRIKATARVKSDSVEIDYSGSDKQSIAAVTTCWEDTNRCLIGPKTIFDPRHPMNAGAMRPFHVIAPPGSLVMGLPPTSASQHVEMATKVAALMINLFGQMIPERAIATDSATTAAYLYSGVDQRSGREGIPFGGVTLAGGSYGGTSRGDGISFNVSPIFNCRSNVVELLERDMPMLIRGWGLMMDSAGAGKYRSGYSSYVIYEINDGKGTLTAVLDSGRFPRQGTNGGGAGMPSYISKIKRNPDESIRLFNGISPVCDLIPVAGMFAVDGTPDPENGEWGGGGAELSTLKLTSYPLREGELYHLFCASGAGYGSPLERDPKLVRLDVWNEQLSFEFAKHAYGVVIDPVTLAVDTIGTTELRKELRKKEAMGEWKAPMAVLQSWPKTVEEFGELERMYSLK